MAIHWRLKSYLSEKHCIYRPTQLQKLIIKKTGVQISLRNLCNYLDHKPKTLRLQTFEIVCSALECELHDFCEVKPAKQDPSKMKKLSYQNTPHSKRATRSFPDPKDYS